jgi:hypothetical protein
MIRNLLILDRNGKTVHCSSFGDCYSACDNSEELSDFVNALTGYGKILSDDMLNEIQTADLRFLIRTQANLIFTISTDDANIQEHDATLTKMIDLFTHFYATLQILSKSDTTAFQDFPKYLLDQEIMQLNC